MYLEKRKAIFSFAIAIWIGQKEEKKHKYTRRSWAEKKKKNYIKKSGGGGECERNRVPICERRNLRIYDVHIILLRQMASLFKARFLKGIH